MNEKQEIIDGVLELTAGEMLRNARTTGRRKRELSTIAKTLCIKEEFLDALENGRYTEIPETVYVLGFARNYAIELGLNPEEVVNKLKQELGLVLDEKEVVSEYIKNEHTHHNIKDFFNKYAQSFLKYIRSNKKSFIIYLSLVLVFCVLLIVFLNKTGSVAENVQSTDVEQVTEEKAVIKEPDYKIPVRETFETKNKSDSRVVLQATKDSWIKIEDARGNTVFSRVMVTGDVYYVPAGDKYKATFGNVGAIDVWVDGRLIKQLGSTNTRKTDISMSPESLKSFGFAG